MTLSAGSGAVTVAGQDATLDAPTADERRQRARAAQLERLRAIGAEQIARRARRAAIEAELAQLRAEGAEAEFEAAPLLAALLVVEVERQDDKGEKWLEQVPVALVDPSCAEQREQLRHDTTWPR